MKYKRLTMLILKQGNINYIEDVIEVKPVSQQCKMRENCETKLRAVLYW